MLEDDFLQIQVEHGKTTELVSLILDRNLRHTSKEAKQSRNDQFIEVPSPFSSQISGS